MLFPLSTPSNDDSEILSGVCGAPGPNAALAVAGRFPEACIALSSLCIKRGKDEEDQKRIAASSKTS